MDEFKQQLYFLHQNIASNSSKTQELQENTEQLLALFNKIDQMEVCIAVGIARGYYTNPFLGISEHGKPECRSFGRLRVAG